MSREGSPPIHCLYVNLTDHCNLRCLHCWLSAEMEAPPLNGGAVKRDNGFPLSPSVMREVVRQSKPLGLHSIKLTGGEPFLRGDIMDFVSLFHEEGLNVDIETNGTLIDEATARGLRRFGVRGISVSLDSSGPEAHDRFRGVKGAFSHALAGIRRLVREGVPTQIIMSLCRENAGEIEPLARLSVNEGVWLLKINPVLPMGRGNDLHRGGGTLSVEELLESLRWVREELQQSIVTPIYFNLPVAFQPMREIIAGRCPECAVLNILGIVENGDISFCGVQKVTQGLVVGNVRKDRMADVWLKHPILKRMREDIPYRLEGICGKCFFKALCLGSCLACTYYLEKRLTAPYWFCREAFEKGLFPATRYAEEDR